MKIHPGCKVALLLCAGIASIGFAQEEIPTPAEIVDFEIGSDRNLANWNRICEYFDLVGSASPRVSLLEMGKSTDGRRMIAAYISSQANIARLDELLATQKDLTYLPAQPEECGRWSCHKPFVLINCCMHSDEIGSSQMSLKLVYNFATAEDAETRRLLDKLVIILIPSTNPDGLDMEIEWYKRWLGTPYEGCLPPVICHKHAGKENNRDWFALNMQESRVLNHWMSNVWFPQVVWDLHQHESTSMRGHTPPFVGPPNPFIHPQVIAGIAGAGRAMQSQALRDGYRGIGQDERFSLWWNGGFRTTPCYKNAIGLLTQLASAKLATPIDVPPEKLICPKYGTSLLEKTMANPAPWPGGVWRLSDIVGVELSFARGLLRQCADSAEQLISDYRNMCLEARSAKGGGPAGYLLKRDQFDRAALEHFAKLMQAHGVEVNELAEDLELAGETYPAGTALISGFQPFRPFILSMFERVQYPEMGMRPDGEPNVPYDLSGWTLVDQLGLEVRRISRDEWNSTESVKLTRPYESKPFEPTAAPNGDTVYTARDSESYMRINAILRDGGSVTRQAIKTSEGVEHIFKLSKKGQNTEGDKAVRLPRLALLRGYFKCFDEGWTRLLLEKFGFPFTTLNEDRVKAGDLGKDFDAIILPFDSVHTQRQLEHRLISGNTSSDYPPEFRGGIGEEGIEAFKQFVEGGGTLICLSGSGRVIIERFGLPVIDLLEKAEPPEFLIPGSLIRFRFDTSHPLAFGMAEKVIGWFSHSLAFEVPEDSADMVEVVARYADSDILVSGLAKGEEKIAGKAAAVIVKLGEGNVVLIGFPCQFRAQPYATFKLLFNSIYMAGGTGE